MIEERELISMLISLAVLIFPLWYRRVLMRFSGWLYLFCAYLLLVTSWVSSVVEGFIWEDGFNLVQHSSSMLSAVLFAIWCWKYGRIAITDSEQEDSVS